MSEIVSQCQQRGRVSIPSLPIPLLLFSFAMHFPVVTPTVLSFTKALLCTKLDKEKALVEVFPTQTGNFLREETRAQIFPLRGKSSPQMFCLQPSSLPPHEEFCAWASCNQLYAWSFVVATCFASVWLARANFHLQAAREQEADNHTSR